MLFGRNSILSGLLTLFLVTEAAHCAAPAGTCAYDDVQSFLSCSTRYTTKQPKSVTRSTYTEFRTVSRAVTTTVTVDVVTSRDPNLLATTTITAHPTSTSTVLTVSSVTTVWTSTVTTSLYYTIYTTTTINPGTTTVVVTPPPRSVPTPVGFVAVLNDPTNSALYTDLPAKKFRRAAEPAPDPVSKPIAEPLAGPFAEPLPVGIPNVAPVGIGRRANYPVAVTCKKTIRVTFVTTITQTVGRRTSRLPGRTTTQTVHIPPTYWVHYTPTNAITLHWTESLVRTVGPSFTTTLTSTVTGNSTVTSYLPQQTVYAACGLGVNQDSIDACEPKLPFHVRIMDSTISQDSFNLGKPQFDKLVNQRYLPASYRTKRDLILVPSFDDFEFLQRELLVKRLDDIRNHLWLVGRPMPPRPLHYQLVLSRSIVVTEAMDLHLVWSGPRIFVKPIPSYLLDSDFWATHLACSGAMEHGQREAREDLAKSARGFLFTYTALISYESDFRIAQQLGLLPEGMTWDNWREFTRQFLRDFRFSLVNPRFWYGELRLSRLNSIYRWRKGLLWRGYSKVSSHTSYGDLLRDNFHLLAAILGYVVIVLTAMQVGLATEQLQANVPFQNVSYGISVLAMIAPLIIGVAIFGVVLFIVGYNWAITRTYERRRFREMGLLQDWERAEVKGRN
ncbi:hypothetical protein Dda_0008 [Drechslerella dactyloides]|uniref:Uncharacterized protein n=1 Tax=Drechslerella dactyloides TaxID=74499 RepID=A0AAD6J4E5_DREDA|nr:hypothetical protein Dda_0008 [Drechslerella dactyloides]